MIHFGYVNRAIDLVLDARATLCTVHTHRLLLDGSRHGSLSGYDRSFQNPYSKAPQATDLDSCTYVHNSPKNPNELDSTRSHRAARIQLQHLNSSPNITLENSSN